MHNLDQKSANSTIGYQINTVFNQLDKNQDSGISKTEFIEECLNDEFLLYFLSPNIDI